MSDVYVIRNQHGHYRGKAKTWVDGAEPRAILQLRHEDEALNTLFELSSRDDTLRGQGLAVALTARGEPDVEPGPALPPAADVPANTTAAAPPGEADT